jgi:selenocysteine lyase/cysteine desulfurase
MLTVAQDAVEVAEAAFRRAYPGYAKTAALDDLRASEYARLDAGGQVYLDYTGGGLYASSQLREHFEMLQMGVFGNPHSLNPTSAASSALVERARARVLEFFRASPDEYVAIFTPNATGALRLVGEAYPFHAGDRFLLTFDNHNSVNGIREFARARRAETTYVPSVSPDLRVDPDLLPRYLTETVGDHHNLFAFPAQSNFSGVQHPLEWIEQAHALGWDVMLDAAAFVPTNRLDLGVWHPDYVPISFYKMFGWPTGVGCLLARRDALRKLERPWFSGGTIVAAFVQRQYYQSAPGAAHFEDGTLNYLSLPAVDIGLRFLDRVGIENVHARVTALSGWLLTALDSLRHSDGSPVVVIYGPHSSERRGATIAFNFLHPDGRIVDERYVDRVAGEHGISLRTGCFCNPGAGEVAFTVSRETLLGGEFGEGMVVEDYIGKIGLSSGGAIRVSLGIASNFADLHRFISFTEGFIDLSVVPDDLPPRTIC